MIVFAGFWFLSGFLHALGRTVHFCWFVKDWSEQQRFGNDHFGNIIYARRLTRQIIDNSTKQRYTDFAFTTFAGFAGIAVVGFDWLVRLIVRHWPERLVLGGEPTKPAAVAIPTPTKDEVNLELLMRKAGIFNNR